MFTYSRAVVARHGTTVVFTAVVVITTVFFCFHSGPTGMANIYLHWSKLDQYTYAIKSIPGVLSFLQTKRLKKQIGRSMPKLTLILVTRVKNFQFVLAVFAKANGTN